ncbi:MAG: pyruvate ferredoxin oxidoreductase [Nanoarchaeota archaeon]|nr:pyruvate ferredoxin oxidoreductase [Nanoarchaeota archaeon]MBU0963036.1 pyruvate ferredoxin oxidoreductase [Nanoarchaeota archaeon]
MNIKELGYKDTKFVSGHRACAGCGFPQIVRTILNSTDKRVVVANATGCLEVVSTIYPFSSWKVPYMHSVFGNASSTISGIESAYKVLKKKNKIKNDIKFLAIMGDGGCSDIGLQSLSGALERGHECVYVQYANGAYQNTGVQRSSETPLLSNTTTTPVGKVHRGKEEMKKDIVKIVAAHNIPYIAQASMAFPEDLSEKAKKAFETKGPSFINVIQPCVPGWKIDTSINIKLSRLAVETGAWPLFEIENGKFKLNYVPEKLKPVKEYLKLQGRFKHLNNKEIERIQKIVNKEWEYLKKGDFWGAREY